MLTPVARKSLSDAVYEQLRDAIVAGELAPGSALPSERALCETLGVNRGALREALKRLAESSLVQLRHGGATRVLDFREHGGLGLLPSLLLTSEGAVRPRAARSIVEMRGALAPDIARRAAERAGPDTIATLRALLASMAAAGEHPGELQRLALKLWGALVDGSDNLAYRLSYNTLRDAYEVFMHLLTDLMATEFADGAGYLALVDAVEAGDGDAAELAARAILGRGTARLSELFDAMERLDAETAG